MSTLARRRPAAAAPAARARRRLVAEPGLLGLIGVTAAVDAAASLVRHANFGTGFDLALFDQVVWRYSHFAAPYSSIEGQNILGDHFHPLLAILAPLYWIWSDPRTLLIAQAVLIAASIAPVFWFARPRLGRVGAYLLAAGYAAFWGLQVGVLFEFHELAFAPLLIALAILWADRERWGFFWVTIVLLLLVKEDLSLLVVAFGIWRLTLRDVRRGIVLAGLGAGWYALTTGVLIPHFARGRGYTHWFYGQLGKNSLAALWTVVHSPWTVFQIGFSPGQKVHTMAALFGAFLLLSLGSRLVILTLPLLAERFLASNPNLWGTHYHYSLTIAPVLAMAAAAGLANLSRWVPAPRRALAVQLGAAAILVVNVALTETMSPDSSLTAISRPSFYHAPSWAPAARGGLNHVPAGASALTVATTLPHVSERPVLGLINPYSVGVGRYMLVNLVAVDCCGLVGNTDYRQLGSVIDQQLPGLVPIYYRDGWLVARRAEPGQRPSNGVLTPLGVDTARVVEQDARRWQAGYHRALARFGACAPLWLRRDRAAPGCYRSAVGSLERGQRRLAADLASAQAGLRGGCQQLAHVALSATAGLTADLGRIADSAASFATSRLTAASRRYLLDTGTLDLGHALDRFLILCTPRR